MSKSLCVGVSGKALENWFSPVDYSVWPDLGNRIAVYGFILSTKSSENLGTLVKILSVFHVAKFKSFSVSISSLFSQAAVNLRHCNLYDLLVEKSRSPLEQ